MTEPPGNNGPVLIVSAPSGVGKTSLINRLISDDPAISVAVSHTTRPRRSREQDGVHYHFVSEEKFNQLRCQDGFVETAEVFGYFYGVSWDALARARKNSELVVLEIDWQGAHSVRVRGISCQSVFIFPPSKEAQIERLTSRDQDTEDVIARRLKQTHDDCMHYHEFDYQIINDDFDRALSELRQVSEATRNNEKTTLPDVSSIADKLIYDLSQSLH